MFESRISAEATKNYQGGKNLTQKNVEWPCDMEGYAQKCVERYCELAKKKFKQLCEVSTTCLRGFWYAEESTSSWWLWAQVNDPKIEFCGMKNYVQTVSTRARSFNICTRSWELRRSCPNLRWKPCNDVVGLHTSSSTKAAHLRPCYTDKLEVNKNARFWGHKEFFRYHSKVGFGELRKWECEFYLKWKSFMGKIQIAQWSRNQVDEGTYLLRFCLVLGQDQGSERSESKKGTVKWQNFAWKTYLENCREWMENQLNSSGIFSQDFHHCGFFRKSKGIWRNETSKRKSSVIGSSSCLCSTTSNGLKWNEEICSNSEKVKAYASSFSQGHWTVIAPGTTNQREMGLSCFSNGSKIWTDRSSRFHRCQQCFESWCHEREEQERHHPLQWGIFQHRASISNQSPSKAGLFLRGSHRLVSKAG